ncbi:MAG: tRNA epoxyqueuosine(34) reductase QueG [Verrucomicrobia bacterium]|nr:tRNA epoxyqueuosine(34) reductase QueG [Verrucomicrobiota bacterium]MCH8511409.1 tRNA epoxyqueuosine(34) reductase QueG [Kiritimatiellia bacterium]
MNSAPSGLTARLKEAAIECGFDLVGVAAAQPVRHAAEFRQWLRDGHHADMDWIARDIDRRLDPRNWRPDTRSMVVVGVSYHMQNPAPRLWNDPMRGRVARYAWGRDYHKVIGKRLKKLAEWVRKEGPEGVEVQPFNDARPVMEHDAALAAGLGFVGRNTLLIHPDYGSMIFLGGLLVSCELEPDDPTPGSGAVYQGKAECGACTRCLKACPTHAFPAAYILNSRLCISYQTIENRGEIPESLRPKLGNWIFGCDVCQEVCPWVKRYSRVARQPWLDPDPDRMAPRLDELAALDEEAFFQRFAGTPLMRTKRAGLLRNVAVALGNSGTPEALPALEILAADANPLIASHAQWGLKQPLIRMS